MKIIIIGGGAAGFFASIRVAELRPEMDVTILERGKEVLQKVKISGGGRCNVTHAEFVNKLLTKNYPRGDKALMSPFSKFSTGDTMDWFEKKGVSLKIEEDGRVFPDSDNSQTIIDCLYGTAMQLGVKVLRNHRVDKITIEADGRFILKTNVKDFEADKVMLATGSSTSIWQGLKLLGHSVIEPVPSLFTFNINDLRFKDLAGLSLPLVEIQIMDTKLKSSGSFLITHWGISGPAVLRLSAWGARILHAKNYQFNAKINLTGGYKLEEVHDFLNETKLDFAKKQITNTPLYDLPSRLWQRLLVFAAIPEQIRWADVPKKQLQTLASTLTEGIYAVNGKSTFKEEFVTAGGIELDEVDFKRFESKKIKNMFFAGEVLDIDAITGGFNFQAAWSGGWIAGTAMAESSELGFLRF
jgi:predicted Rossmann fold flavoprotein